MRKADLIQLHESSIKLLEKYTSFLGGRCTNIEAFVRPDHNAHDNVVGGGNWQEKESQLRSVGARVGIGQIWSDILASKTKPIGFGFGYQKS